jgi:hypothetical protein
VSKIIGLHRKIWQESKKPLIALTAVCFIVEIISNERTQMEISITGFD